MQVLKLAERLALVAILPLLLVLAMLLGELADERSAAERAAEILPVVRLSRVAGTIMFELQKERGASASYLADRERPEFKALLARQRLAADKAIAGWSRVKAEAGSVEAGHGLARSLEAVDAGLARLPQHRAEVDTGGVTIPASIAFYTALIGEMIGITGDMARSLTEKSLADDLEAYRLYLTATDLAGRERAIGAALFADARFDLDRWRSFVEIGAEQALILREFVTAAPAAFRRFAEAAGGAEATALEAMRRRALDLPKGGQATDVTAPAWFAVASARIDRMKSVQDAIASTIAERTVAEATAARRRLWEGLAWRGAGGILIAGVVLMMSRSISVPLGRIAGNLDEAAEGTRMAAGRVRAAAGEISRVTADLDSRVGAFIEWIRSGARAA